jgi:hypothetical protein
MKNVITTALTWNADDFDDILGNLIRRNQVTEEASIELFKMSNEYKADKLESYITDNQEQIIELINDIITEGMMKDYANDNQ